MALAVFGLATLAQGQGTPAKPAQSKPAKQSTPASPTSKPAPAASAVSTPVPSAGAKPVPDDFNTWTKPLYRTAKGVERTIIQVDKFPYRESTYTSTQPIEILPKDRYRFITPEDSLVSRLSAMANLDYDGWLKTWDDKSQAFLKQVDARPEFGAQKRINQWKGVFSAVKPVLVRRIETGSYVIVTYKLVNKDGKDVGIFEFPTALKEVGGLWLGTEELSSDPLMNLSPWVSGKMSEEADARPMSQTVIK